MNLFSLNSSIIEEARDKDKKRPKNLSVNSIYGMPILLKDNINAKGMVTTAGAAALMKNTTEDSFLSQQLKSSGALILGKANLSEWAYFFCGDCPSGYSAVGGQTFNPYGRKTLDTGGSSSGSAVAVAANFCAAAIGSETSGSILSPASQNAGVGLKPTIGTVSRSGIIPISSTLDTAGPITKTIIDNILVFNAIIGYDDKDFKSTPTSKIDLKTVLNTSFKGKRFGAIKELLNDSLYSKAIKLLEKFTPKIVILDVWLEGSDMDGLGLLKIIKEKDIGGIVVGLPLNMNGTKGPRCQSVETFFRNFLIFHDIPLLFQDERMSSQAIEKIFISQDVSRKKRSSNIDKHAACWILQSALDFLKKR